MRTVRWAVVGALLGAAFSVLGLSLAGLLDERLWWLALLLAATGSGITGALVAAEVRRARSLGGGTLIGGTLLLALVGAGLWLWLPGGGDPGTMDTDLGAALLGGAVVAFAVLVVQQRLEADRRSRDEARAAEADRYRLREQAQTLVVTAADLRGVDFSGRDLSDMHLAGKRMDNANLAGCDLRRSVLAEADLSGADLRNADLSGATAPGASFRGATLEGANLTDALLEGADLRGCDLVAATLAGARLTGAKYGNDGVDKTHWPDGFDVCSSGAIEA